MTKESPPEMLSLSSLKVLYKDCSDVVFYSFTIGEAKAHIVYITGLSNVEEINDNVIPSLLNINELEGTEMKIPLANIRSVQSLEDCVIQLSGGNPLLFLGEEKIYSLPLSKSDKRSIEEPGAEAVIRGPRDGFTESIETNIAQIRKTIRVPELKTEAMTIGEYTKTTVIVTYIKGLARESIIKEVIDRLNRIEIDGVLESGYLEEFIEDNPYSPFPQTLNTERVDVVAAHLLEGKVAIFVDRTPFVLIVPVTFFSLIQSSEDYYQRFIVSSFIRLLRFLLIWIALFLPATYVAVLTFHHEMVPTTLIISIASSRETVPFPAVVEALIMEITFEGLREAGIRLPKQVGSAVGIVGGLVIGEAAVSAGLVSAPMVMVVAFTGIASFTIPRYNASLAVRMLRFPLIILAGVFGLVGIMMGLVTIIILMCSMRSFGAPYLSPVGPINFSDLKDVFYRAPWWKMAKYPQVTNRNMRIKGNLKPSPKQGGE